jgi:hypothetical protein
MKTLALGTFLCLLVVGAAFHAVAQSVEEQRRSDAPGVVENQGGSDTRSVVEKQAGGDTPSAPLEGASAQPGECKADFVAVSGRGKFRPFSKNKELEGRGTAMADAVADWEREVGDKFGKRWKLWSEAKDKSFDCAQAGGKVIDGLITCTIQGRPCASDAPTGGDGVTADKSAPRPLQTVDQGVDKQEGRDTARCYGIITAVGSEQTSKKKAIAAAHDAWIARVRFDFGERYTDLNNSVDASAVCTTSTPVSPAVIIKRVYFRCKIWARPCPAATGGIERLERRYQEEDD